MAMFGGIVWVVSALRIKPRTIIIRVKEVIITRRLGSTARPAKMITSLTGVDQSLASVSVVAVLSISFIKSDILGIWSAGVEAGVFSCARAKPANDRTDKNSIILKRLVNIVRLF